MNWRIAIMIVATIFQVIATAALFYLQAQGQLTLRAVIPLIAVAWFVAAAVTLKAGDVI